MLSHYRGRFIKEKYVLLEVNWTCFCCLIMHQTQHLLQYLYLLPRQGKLWTVQHPWVIAESIRNMMDIGYLGIHLSNTVKVFWLNKRNLLSVLSYLILVLPVKYSVLGTVSSVGKSCWVSLSGSGALTGLTGALIGSTLSKGSVVVLAFWESRYPCSSFLK